MFTFDRVAKWCDAENKKMVSTIFASDAHGYETAIAHSDFNDGELIVVEYAHDEQSALLMHDKWVKVLQDDTTNEFVSVQFGETFIRKSIN